MIVNVSNDSFKTLKLGFEKNKSFGNNCFYASHLIKWQGYII